MDRETALTKIKKCLALGRSPNQHEATTALRQAQKLMAQFGIDDTDIKLADVSESGSATGGVVVQEWEVSLGRAIALAFGCDFIIERGHRLALKPQARRSSFIFFGVGAAAEVAAYANDVLNRQCSRARQEHIAQQPHRCKRSTKTARGDAFAISWVWAVAGMLDKFANGDRDKPLLEAYKANRWSELGTFTPKSRIVESKVKDSSFLAGQEAGSKARLERGLGAAQGKPMIEGGSA